MCGIFGVIKNNRKRIDIGTLRALTMCNRERGNESLGFFDSSESIHKIGDDPIDVLARDDTAEWLGRAEKEAWFIVGHTRNSTRGKVCDKNSHPFKYGKVIGAHNGIVSAPNNYTVDSEFLIDLLDQNQSDYQQALGGEWGYWTLSWFDARTGDLYVSMHDNTCGIVDYRGAWYFSSDPDHLMSATGCTEVIVLENGDTVKFTPSGKMHYMTRFKSNVSYSYKKSGRTSGARFGYDSDWEDYYGTGLYRGYSGASSSGQINQQTTMFKPDNNGWPENQTVNVKDPEHFVRDYDTEFREIWEEYCNQYAG